MSTGDIRRKDIPGAESRQAPSAEKTRKQTSTLNILKELSDLFDQQELTLPDMLDRAVEIFQTAFHAAASPAIRITVDDHVAQSHAGVAGGGLRAVIRVEGMTRGLVSIHSEEGKTGSDGQSVWQDRECFVHVVANMIGQTVGRIEAKKALQKKQLFQEKEKTQNNFYLLAENVPAAYAYIDVEERYAFVNRKYAELVGMERDHIVGRKVQEVLLADFYEAVRDHMARALSGERVEFETSVDRRKDRICYSIIKYLPDVNFHGDIIGFFALITDITDRKMMEDALIESEQNFRMLAQNINDGILIALQGTHYCFSNHQMALMTGYEADEINMMTMEDLLAPDQLSRVRSICRNRMEGKPSPAQYETKIVRKDGVLVPVEISAARTQWKGESAAIISMRDITERKKTEQEMRLKTSAMDTSISGIAIADFDGVLTYVNPAFLDMWGYASAEEALGRQPVSFFRRPHRAQEVIDLIRRNQKWTGELLAVRKDGTRFPVQVIAYTFEAGGGAPTHILASFLDISDKKSIDRELRRADKLISMGVLSAGVAHEIGNPINLVGMNASILADIWESLKIVLDERFEKKGDFDAGGLPYSEMAKEVPHLISGIKNGANRTHRIIRQLKEFAGEEPADSVDLSVDVNETIENAMLLLANVIKNTTDRMTVNFGENLPPVKGDKQKIEQVMVNLIHNACNAVDERDQRIEVTSRMWENGGGIVVDIRDEGRGITAEVLPRIMEPFFTTRRKEGGMGFGLSVSRDIVREHGGELTVESRPGKGTLFRVVLPADSDSNRMYACQRASPDE